MKINGFDELYLSAKGPNRKETCTYLGNKAITQRIVSNYFKKVKELVLEGFEFDFDIKRTNIPQIINHFGSIRINKIRKIRKKSYTDKRRRLKYNRIMLLTYNLKMIGFYFEIKHDWDLLEENNMEFKACPAFRKKLFKNLYYENQDYLLKQDK